MSVHYAIAAAKLRQTSRAKRQYVHMIESQLVELERENTCLREQVAHIPQLLEYRSKQEKRIVSLEEKLDHCEFEQREDAKYRREAQKRASMFFDCLELIEPSSKTIFFDELSKRETACIYRTSATT